MSEETTRTEINELGEFGLINHLTKNFPLQNSSTVKGVGDDAAVLDYEDKKIEVATHSNTSGRRFDPDEVNATFWHELVHAILHDMGSPLYHNEAFVAKFSRRLSQAIRTARF